jgi:hypothetical protein
VPITPWSLFADPCIVSFPEPGALVTRPQELPQESVREFDPETAERDNDREIDKLAERASLLKRVRYRSSPQPEPLTSHVRPDGGLGLTDNHGHPGRGG